MATTEELLRASLEQNQELMKQIKLLTEQVAYLTDKLYGHRSEKMVDPNQQSLFQNDGVFTEPEQTGEKSEEPEVGNGTPNKRKHRRSRDEAIADNLPTEDELTDVADHTCEHGHMLTHVGKHFVRKEVRYIPGRKYVAVIYESTYKCETCEQNDGCSHIYQGKAPNALLAHSLLSSSLAAQIINNKYVLAVPLYRQLNQWKRSGLDISETTAANWIIQCANVVKPIYNLLHETLMCQKFLQGDETPYEVLREPGKTATSRSYIWVARSVSHSDSPAVYYHYADSRSGSTAQALYRNFTGVLQCDGYAGYNALGSGITRIGCWAHVRRKFYDAANASDFFKPSKGLNLINRMFTEEKEWRHFSAEERLYVRQQKLTPIINEFWKWCDSIDVLPKERLGKALVYAQGQRAALNRVLLYGEVDLSNNASERNMKTYVIGRKNWLFSTSPKGAEANAIWLTLIESAKANRLDPLEYIECLLSKLPQLPTFTKSEELIAYLPWNYQPKKQLTTVSQ